MQSGNGSRFVASTVNNHFSEALFDDKDQTTSNKDLYHASEASFDDKNFVSETYFSDKDFVDHLS